MSTPFKMTADSLTVVSDLLSNEVDCGGSGVKMLADDFFLIFNKSQILAAATLLSPFDPQEYCIERYVDLDNTSSFVAVVCDSSSQMDMTCAFKYTLYPVFMALSCLGLVVTILVYSCLQQLRNTPGKIVLSLCSALLMAFVVLIGEQLLAADVDSIGWNLCLLMGIYATPYFYMQRMSLNTCCYSSSFTGNKCKSS